MHVLSRNKFSNRLLLALEIGIIWYFPSFEEDDQLGLHYLLTYFFAIYIIKVTSLTENIYRIMTFANIRKMVMFDNIWQIFAKGIVENICLLRLGLLAN